MNGKRWMALLLALVMSFSLLACGAKPAENTGDNSQNTAADGTTRVFTDSCGREVTVPVNVEKIAVSGPLAQIVVFAMAPDKLVGIANAWDESAAEFLDKKYYNLPILGQLYGGKGELNLETLLAVLWRIWMTCRSRPAFPLSTSMPTFPLWMIHTPCWETFWQCPTRRRGERTTAASPMTALCPSPTAWIK